MNRNPPVTAYGGDSPLWQGGLWSRTGAFKHPSPLVKGGCPEGAGGFPYGRDPPGVYHY